MSKSCCEGKTESLIFLRNKQGKILKIVMAINLAMFFIEFASGWFAESTALMADSLDMLGDAIVYGFSLYVLHKSERLRATAALLKGLIIVTFGLFVFGQASYKALTPGLPIPHIMGAIGLLALIANGICLLLLTIHKDDDINMKSTWVCSRNDIISNTGVIIGAGLVFLTESKWPDIILGFIISIIFLKSAWSILKESAAVIKKESPEGS
ncbi:MAG: cation diffusion facilitator family transporter [Bdellovibrionota bacterium]